MDTVLAGVALVVAAMTSSGARAAPADEVQTVYGRFLAAQNARDLQQVRSVLWDSPKFLWVSDGRSVWGPDALVERMSRVPKGGSLACRTGLGQGCSGRA